MNYTVALEQSPNASDAAFVDARLAEYNRAQTGRDEPAYQRFAAFVRDGSGAIVGGLLGGTY